MLIKFKTENICGNEMQIILDVDIHNWNVAVIFVTRKFSIISIKIQNDFLQKNEFEIIGYKSVKLQIRVDLLKIYCY